MSDSTDERTAVTVTMTHEMISQLCRQTSDDHTLQQLHQALMALREELDTLHGLHNITAQRNEVLVAENIVLTQRLAMTERACVQLETINQQLRRGASASTLLSRAQSSGQSSLCDAMM